VATTRGGGLDLPPTPASIPELAGSDRGALVIRDPQTPIAERQALRVGDRPLRVVDPTFCGAPANVYVPFVAASAVDTHGVHPPIHHP